MHIKCHEYINLAQLSLFKLKIRMHSEDPPL